MKPGFNLPFELPEISEPVFPDQVFDIRDFGAVPDGVTLNTEAFNRVVETCHSQGGGMIFVPGGD